MSLKAREIGKGLVLFIVYFVTAVGGLKLSAVSDFATLLWIPTGFSIAALYVWGRKFWPAITLGAFATNFFIGASLPTAITMSIGNTLEAYVAVTLFLRFAGNESRLEKVNEVTAYILTAALVGPVISATFGVSCLAVQSKLIEPYFHTWSVWFAGDAISSLVIAPFLIVWRTLPKLIGPRKRMIEGTILVACVVSLCLIIFGPFLPQELHYYIRSYWIFVFLIWTTLRFGQPANTIMVLVLFAIAVTSTILGYGPYHANSLTENLFHLQTFLSVVAISGLYFAALGTEKDEALRIRTDFISIASHELRTPLTSFEVTLHYLKALIEEHENLDRAPDAIAILERQSKKMASLVDTLLNVAKIESGNLIMEKKETDLSALVTNVAGDLRGLMAHTHCSVNLKVQPLVKGNFSAYGIEQVLTNLMLNAMKYGPGAPVQITLEHVGTRARISVQDEGRGIAREDLQRIFDRYERVKKGNSTQGLGLGLYISKLIVDAHDGKISVTSEPGKGSTFTVDLPVS